VDKYIFATRALDKSIALGGIKPFHYTFFSHLRESPVPFPASRDE
jgi:hypothetical protein